MASLAAKAVEKKKTKKELIMESRVALYNLKVAIAAQKMSTKTYSWSYIYLVRCGEFHKIGYAYNVASRFDSFKTSNPYDISLEFALKVPNAKKLEGILHEKYQSKRYKREWFRLDGIDIAEIKDLCQDIVNES